MEWNKYTSFAGQAQWNMIFNSAQYLPDLEMTSSALGVYTNVFLVSDYCIISDIFIKNTAEFSLSSKWTEFEKTISIVWYIFWQKNVRWENLGMCCPATPQVQGSTHKRNTLQKSRSGKPNPSETHTVTTCEMQGMFFMVQVDGLCCAVTDIWIHIYSGVSSLPGTPLRCLGLSAHYTSPTQVLVFADLRQELRTKDSQDKICKQIKK